MSYHGAILNGEFLKHRFVTREELTKVIERAPQDVIITKTEPHQFAGPLPLGPEKLAIGGPDPEKPDWIAIVNRQPDGSWKVL